MSRLTLTLDRIATLLVGLVILAAGLYALVWWQDRATTIPARLHTSVLNDVTAEGWWPWAAAIGGLVLVFVGVRWLAAHLPRRSLPAFRLPGSSPRGRLQIESSAVADAAARELSAAPGISDALKRGAEELFERAGLTKFQAMAMRELAVGKTPKSIAFSVGITPDTARSRIHDARQKILSLGLVDDSE
jgi:hypothetical protein